MATVSGRVFIEQERLAEFEIIVLSDVMVESVIGIANTDGMFSVEVPPGEWTIAIVSEATPPHRHTVSINEQNQQVVIGDIHLARGSVLTGRIQDRFGPIPEVTVVLFCPAAHPDVVSVLSRPSAVQKLLGIRTCVSDSFGQFVISGVWRDPGCDLFIEGTKGEWVTMRKKVTWASPLDDVELVASRGGTLRGLVRHLNSSVAHIKHSQEETYRIAQIVGDHFQFNCLPSGKYTVSILDSSGVVLSTQKTRVRPSSLTALDIDGPKVSLSLVVAAGRPLKILGEEGRDSHQSVVWGILRGDAEDLWQIPTITPGEYRVSTDGEITWQRIIVKRTPKRQQVDLRSNGGV